MEEEHFTLGGDTARKVNEAERVIAVGTTATRVLESVADDTRESPTGFRIDAALHLSRISVSGASMRS